MICKILGSECKIPMSKPSNLLPNIDESVINQDNSLFTKALLAHCSSAITQGFNRWLCTQSRRFIRRFGVCVQPTIYVHILCECSCRIGWYNFVIR